MSERPTTIAMVDRWPDEPHDPWVAYTTWLRLGPRRSLPAVAQAHAGRWALGTLETWRVRWHWRARAEAYDAATERGSGPRLEAQRRGEQAEVLDALLGAILAESAKLLSETAATTAPVLKPRELVALTKTVITLQRLLAGEATERVDLSPDFSRLTSEELRQLRTLQNRATNGA